MAKRRRYDKDVLHAIYRFFNICRTFRHRAKTGITASHLKAAQFDYILKVVRQFGNFIQTHLMPPFAQICRIGTTAITSTNNRNFSHF